MTNCVIEISGFDKYIFFKLRLDIIHKAISDGTINNCYKEVGKEYHYSVWGKLDFGQANVGKKIRSSKFIANAKNPYPDLCAKYINEDEYRFISYLLFKHSYLSEDVLISDQDNLIFNGKFIIDFVISTERMLTKPEEFDILYSCFKEIK